LGRIYDRCDGDVTSTRGATPWFEDTWFEDKGWSRASVERCQRGSKCCAAPFAAFCSQLNAPQEKSLLFAYIENMPRDDVIARLKATEPVLRDFAGSKHDASI
jgi:hypothetical protein